MTLNDLNPFIRYGGVHSHYKTNRQNSMCYDCRLFYIKQGEGFLSANGKKYNFSENTLVFLPPETKYSFEFKDYFSIKFLVLNFDLVSDFSDHVNSLGTALESTFDKSHTLNYQLADEFNCVIIQKVGIGLGDKVFEVIKTYQTKDFLFSQKSSAQLKIVLLEMLEEKYKINTEHELARKVIEYIRQNYSRFDLTNLAIAKEFNYHPYHLGRIFKASTKQNVHEYLLDYRLEMAKRLLITTIDSITVIAEKTGFNSYTYFIKLFRERVGVSPLKYRKNNIV